MKLSPQTRWLLLYLKEQHDRGLVDKELHRPLGVATITPLPYPDDMPGGKVGMVHMNGLVRRGWAEEKCDGIYFITSTGLEAATRITLNT